jgi:hypothetical protein
MKYLEGTLLNNIQNQLNNDINQTKDVKRTNNRNNNNNDDDENSLFPSRSPSPHKSLLQKSYIFPVEKPIKPIEKLLKSPKKLLYTSDISNKLSGTPNRNQLNNNKLTSTNKVIANSNTNTSATNSNISISNEDENNLLEEMDNIYNGFGYEFTNENSSIRAYKTIGHTTLSFASIISMKNRPLLDRKVINESNQRKKKEMKERQNRKQQRKIQLQNRKNKLNNNHRNNEAISLPPLLPLETYRTPNDFNTIKLSEDNLEEDEPIQENIDHDVKVEVIRTLSFCEEGRLSQESLESLKSIDYAKIEDIINEYLITPSLSDLHDNKEEEKNKIENNRF